MCWPEGELERALSAGAHQRELLAWFGHAEYRRLATLAAQAAQAARPMPGEQRARTAVFLIPGLLGSQLGWPRATGQAPDLLWLDPADVVAGRLLGLRTGDGGNALATLGAIPHTYLSLKLRLAAAGYHVVMHDYDWRGDIAVAGSALAQRLGETDAAALVLVGHSMGGLVARAALGQCAPATAARVRRVIGIGTPHGGSIGAVQALRATYPALLRLAALDRAHDAATLGRRVFHGFLSLYQMLPHGLANLDVFSIGGWPRAGLRPTPRLLAAARGFVATLPPSDERFISIVGTGRRTVTNLTLAGHQFRYEITDAGDGTVPAARAGLAGTREYSLTCEHSELTRSPRVAQALVDLIETGATARLRAGTRVRSGRRLWISDAMLRAAFARKLDWGQLGTAARRDYLNALNAPPPIYRAPTGTAR